MFEDDVCVDPSSVLDGMPNYANITFSGLSTGPCTDLPEVNDKWPDYATGLLSGFYAEARRLLEVQWSRCMAERRRVFEQSVSREPLGKTALESLHAKLLWRAFKQSVSGEPSTKTSLESLQAKRLWKALIFLRLFTFPFVLFFCF